MKKTKDLKVEAIGDSAKFWDGTWESALKGCKKEIKWLEDRLGSNKKLTQVQVDSVETRLKILYQDKKTYEELLEGIYMGETRLEDGKEYICIRVGYFSKDQAMPDDKLAQPKFVQSIRGVDIEAPCYLCSSMDLYLEGKLILFPEYSSKDILEEMYKLDTPYLEYFSFTYNPLNKEQDMKRLKTIYYGGKDEYGKPIIKDLNFNFVGNIKMEINRKHKNSIYLGGRNAKRKV